MGLPFLDLSFYFDWNDVTLPTPIPITAQCETIQVKWSRGPATGPDPVAPYWFTIYTSLYEAPILLPAGHQLTANLTIPFPPNTLYQICMYDSLGNTGGCQDVYTVYKPSPDFRPTCSNWTAPEPLKVTSSLGRYGWIPQCNKISLTLEDGTPPYRFSAQPALHPPMNVTGITGPKFEWQNILGWTVPFFISLVDSNGKSWSWGPLHSGDGPSHCLDYDPSNKVTFSSPQTVAGAAIGFIFLGSLLTLGFIFAIHKWRAHKHGKLTHAQPLTFYAEGQPHGGAGSSGSQKMTQPSRNTSVLSQTYVTSPFEPNGSGEELRELGSSTSGHRSDSASSPELPHRTSQNVYVVHHDGGRAPVTIYGEEGTRVVELPPSYIGEARNQTVTAPNSSIPRAPPGLHNAINSNRVFPIVPRGLERKHPDLAGPPTTTPSTSNPSLPPGAAAPIPNPSGGELLSLTPGSDDLVGVPPGIANTNYPEAIPKRNQHGYDLK